MTIPSVINKALKAPKVPDISIGNIYLTINGMKVLNNPEQSPWKNLQINSNIKLGISIMKLVTIAMQVVIKRHYLNYMKITFSRLF